MRIALLAHELFPERAKTAIGILRYADSEIVAVLDRDLAGDRVRDHVSDVQDAPIVGDIEAVPHCDALVIGVAPIGGGFEASWRPAVRSAIQRGCDVTAGLHYMLADDEEFARLAEEHGVELRDVRDPPPELSVATGEPVDTQVVLTVGTDCSSGKMTGAFELRNAARKRGLDAAVVPTGQTGIMVAGWGTVVDRVVSDFAAGATEQLVHEAADNDVLFVEGQGALAHPAYSGVTTSILHGSHPDALVLCHVAGRETVLGYDSYRLPDPVTYRRLYEDAAAPLSSATVDAGLLNTQDLDEAAAREAVDSYGNRLGVPATDPIRYDADAVLDAVLE